MGRDREEVAGRGGDGGDTASEGTDNPTDSRRILAGIHEWVFLTGNRWVLAGCVLVVFFGVVTAIELYAGPTSQQLVPLFYATSAIIGGNFTLLTIVISINQLVISQQLSAPGELREQIENTTTYRRASSELVEEEVPPPTPAAFLEVLLEGVRDSVRDLDSHRAEIANDDAVMAIDDVMGPLERHTNHSVWQLEKDDTSIFEALVVTLNTNYSDDIYEIWRLRTAHEDAITPDAKECLAQIVARLKQIDVARQYLKTVYIQEELSRLSRDLLYVGIPVILVGFSLMTVFVSTDSAFLSPRQLSMVTPVFVTLGGSPLALLFAYVLRLSVVSERTVAITPFTTPTQESTSLGAITEDADD